MKKKIMMRMKIMKIMNLILKIILTNLKLLRSQKT